MVSTLGAHEARAGFGLIGALLNSGVSSAAAQAVAFALALGVLAAAYLHYRRARDERIVYCAALVASLMLTPVLWSHYLLLIAAALLAIRARPAWFLLLALASWAIAPPHGFQLDHEWFAVVGGWNP
jgi:hypothetical protein